MLPADTAVDGGGSEREASHDWLPIATVLLLAIKFSGKGSLGIAFTGDELIHILDGTATLEIVSDDGPPSLSRLRAGTMAVIPKGAWHRFHSSEGATQLAATPFPASISSSMSTTRGR